MSFTALLVLAIIVVTGLFFGLTEVVATKGAYTYYRSRLTGRRWARWHGGGYSALDTQWIETGEWFDTSKMVPPRGAGSHSDRRQ